MTDAVRRTVKPRLKRTTEADAVSQARSFALAEVWPFAAESFNGRIRLQTFKAIVGPGEGRGLVDLGAGPCQFAAIAHDQGWKVTAVDARTERLPADLGGVEFVQHDVRTFDVSGFHTISILGLLYHLTLDEQIALLRSCSGARVILETQVHDPRIVPPAAQPWGYDLLEFDGLKGVVYPENQGGALEANPMASVGNPTSFWLTEDSLLDVFERCGYQKVTVVQPPHYSKYGLRRFFVLNGDS